MRKVYKVKSKINLILFISLFCSISLSAQTIKETNDYKFGVSGYIRSGIARDGYGNTQVAFQMPGALNKFSYGNQPDTYVELEFDYTHYLNSIKDKSIDIVWMNSFYKANGKETEMSFNPTEQLFVRFNNLFGYGEKVWFGKRFYDRKQIHMLDRFWMNPGQKGIGLGVEGLISKDDSEEDLKVAAWRFDNKDKISYQNGIKGTLVNYTADVRWVNVPLNDNFKFNFAADYSYRAANKKMGYKAEHGVGLSSWIDYNKNNISSTTALLYRKGASMTTDHWSGTSIVENPGNDNIVTADLRKSYSLELNQNFLYDNMNNFALNVVAVGAIKNYGTLPKAYNNGAFESAKGYGNGKSLSWVALGVRPIYYLSDQFRISGEVSQEFINNKSLNAKGGLTKLTFSPEFSLTKGFYSRPVLRTFVNYAFWSDGLKGHVSANANNGRYFNKTSGFTYGLQFEFWW